MKDFFKNLLASFLGCSIALAIVAFFSFVVFAVIASSSLSFGSSEKFVLEDNTVLTLKLSGTLSDRVMENPLAELLGQDVASAMALEDVLSAIKKAKENDKIKGIYIHASMFSASSASLKEVRDLLLDFKESGKFIVAYADTYMQGCYYLSSVADKLIINPIGNLDLHGLASGPTFYKGLLDKLGIEMQIFKVGTFKSAVEPFMLDKMSDANKEQVNSYINDVWGTLLEDIAVSRKISVDSLNRITDSFPLLSNPETLVEKGLVDTLMYETDVKKYLKSRVGIAESDDLNQASVNNMKTVARLAKEKSNNVIAVLYAEGSIISGSGDEDIADRKYVKELEKLKDNDKVKAVVLRINSPGGSAYASEQIWKAVTDLKEKKPVVVSMGGVAASGGYYMACNASKIIAQPNTLTGSIGIFGMFPNMEGLTKKVGLTFDNVKTNKYADFGDITRPMREDEKAILQGYIERGYDTFLTRCSDGRGIPKDSLDLIAQGRVWTGKQAMERGLVDELGGIDEAIEAAAVLAELGDYELRSYPRQVNFWESFFNMNKEELAAQAVKEYLGKDYKTFMMIKEIREQDFIQARLPYDFDVQ